MITLHDDIEQRSQAWHELRKGLITASQAFNLLADRPINDGAANNFFTFRGLELEPEAIEIYELTRDVDVLRTGFVTNSEYPRCGYSPDGLLPDRVIEVKCFMEKRHTLSLLAVPIEVLAQVHFGMMIADKPLADIIFYNPDLPVADAFKVVTVKQDALIVQNLKDKIKERNKDA